MFILELHCKFHEIPGRVGGVKALLSCQTFNVFFRAFQEKSLHHMSICSFGHVLVSIFKQLT